MSASLDPIPQQQPTPDERRHRHMVELVELFLLKGNTYAFAMVVFAFVIGGVLALVEQFRNNDVEAMEIWKSLIPMATAYLGYVFGKGDRGSKSD